MFNARQKSKRPFQRNAVQRRTTASRPSVSTREVQSGGRFSRHQENAYLYEYERKVKQSFAHIEDTLRRISSLQHAPNFEERAQMIAEEELGFQLPEVMLADSWIKHLDIGQLYAWCVFETIKRMSNDFFSNKPLSNGDEESFQTFLEECGFHTMDISPCADGRLAHVIRYVLRLPYKAVRRKSFAGAMFDVDDSLQKWIETEMLRHREGYPNEASEPTRYLKVAVYHHSSKMPDHEGCAAHGSDTVKAATAALEQLKAFQQSVENSFCCGASIDLLLLGIDTDNDVIRLHLPDQNGEIDVHKYIDAEKLYDSIGGASVRGSYESIVMNALTDFCTDTQRTQPSAGMMKLSVSLLAANFAQIEYVRMYHGGCYEDLGHQECFIGMGIGFEEVQLRNLTFFAYLQTVEEGAKDLDVGIKIFTGLNISRGLPVPVVIRYDYHGHVPGAKERAEARCKQLDQALRQRFKDIADKGFLHTLLMIRDCQNDGLAETIGCSLKTHQQGAH